MSTDLKNSILLWAGAVVLAGAFWATVRFDLLHTMPPWLLWMIGGAGLCANLLGWILEIRRRRRSAGR